MKETRDSIKDIWGERTPHEDGKWPARVDERTLERPQHWVRSACVLCSNGCALDIGVKDGHVVGVRGRETDRVNRGRLGPNSMDGNTRLCTATAAQALKESFGSDGQPGSYSDLDVADCILMAGHNMAATQTVLWSRVLDRRASDNPPKLVVIDPRKTWTAQEADVHLAPRVGTNVALINGLLNLVIEAGNIDEDFIEEHTVGFEKLEETVREYAPERVEQITGVPAKTLRAAARLLGGAEKLFSTVLQGFYQSHQATAASVQVNNLNLIRGMIGRPGCGLLQMNGQPTSENTRETGCDGEFPAFRNWHNPDHVYDLAERWNVDPEKIPHWHLPHHAMEIFRNAELGSLKFLWIICTTPKRLRYRWA